MSGVRLAADPGRNGWTTILCDSLEKVFPDSEPRAMEMSIAVTAFLGERVSWQIAYLPPPLTTSGRLPGIVVHSNAPAGVVVSIGAVQLVPATLAAFDGHDDGYIRDGAGLFPDPIQPVGDEPVRPLVAQWSAIWVDALVGTAVTDSMIDVAVTLHDTDGGTIGVHTVSLTVVPTAVPPLTIVNAQWLHCDGIARYYDDAVFSEGHWRSIENFVAAAVDAGVNAVLTPTWTPPVDTEVGATRTPIQLVGIAENDGDYSFDFSLLHRWIEMCRRNGVTYLEIPHLFTQWGAAFTPAIYVTTDGGLERRFGWDIPAGDPSYRLLLESLLPRLREELDRLWGLDRVFFHLSDEPPIQALEQYLASRAAVADLLEGCTIVDALSDLDFAERGAVSIPVVATDKAGPFLAAGVKPFWLYYCVDQNRDVSNRFMGQPAVRNRTIGAQLHLTGASGFLHWGFNFYNSALSREPINPFQETCAGGEFPAGDAFMVYPGRDRVAWPSIRSRVFAEAMMDHRAMSFLSSLAGTEEVTAIIHQAGIRSLTKFSYHADDYRRMKAALATRISELISD